MSRLGILLAAMIGVSASCAVADDDLVTGVDAERLFSEIEFRHDLQGVASAGAYFAAGREKRTGVIRSICIGVMEQRSITDDIAKKYIQIFSTMPNRDAMNDPAFAFGDQRWIWGGINGKPSGAFVFTRDNVFISVSWQGDITAARDLTSQIDALLVSDRQVAPRGKFKTFPTLAVVDPPRALKRDEPCEIRYQVSNVAPGELVRVSVGRSDGPGSFTPPPGRTPEQSLRFRMPSETNTSSVRFPIAAVTSKNVFWITELEVQVKND